MEDEALIAMSEKLILESYGYKVMVASSGEKAVEAAVSLQDIDLVLMDINLGSGMDGTQAAMKILEQRDLPLAFLSSHSEREVVEKTDGITSYGYILKNSGETVLIASVKMAFRLFEAKLNEKAKEEALRESEKTFRALFEKGPIGVAYHQMLYDGQGKASDYRFLAANDSYQKLTGVNPAGKLATEAFPGIEKDPFDWIGTFGRVARDGEEIRFQQHLEANDRWYDCVGYQYKPDHFVAAFLEITEQKRAERELFAKKEHLRVTLRSIGDAVIATDIEGKVDFLNDVAENLTGWSQDTAKGRPLTEVFRIINAFTRQKCENPVDKALREGTIVGLANHTVLIAADGKEYQIADSAAPIRDSSETVIGVVLVFRDVSDEYALEAALRSSESELKKAQQVARLGSWVWHIQQNRLEWSDQMFTIFGLDKDGFSGDLTQVIAGFIHPDDRARVENSNPSVVTEKQPIPLEYRIIRPDGEVRHVWAEAGELVVGDDGNPTLLRGIVQDITDKKRSEDKITDLLQEKELLLRETHHRVKNNMGLIHSLLTLQAGSYKGGDPRSILDDAAGRVRSMMLLYDRLYRSEQFDDLNARSILVPLIADIVQLFPEVPAVRLEEKIDDIILGAKTISTLGIIINELITNSMKYAFLGRKSGLIRITASRIGSEVYISYQDDGVGFQDTTGFQNSTGSSNSTGFGMQLIKLLVQQLEGTIQLDRSAGTRFQIVFLV
ncbi:MAG: PAS domain S-box protein [Clostridia bacterium]